MDAESSISEKKMIVCELLCYLRAKLSRLPSVTLKNVINDFYSSEQVSEAKEILVNSIDGLNLDKWPKPVRRKQTENKTKMEVDDIFNVFSYLDENLLLDKLPMYVTVNIDNIPSSKIEEGDMRCVLNKLDNVEKRVEELGKLYVKPNCSNHNTTSHHADNLSATVNFTPTHTTKALTNSWADILSIPQDLQASGKAVGGTDVDLDSQPEMDTDYTVVSGRKRRPAASASVLVQNSDSRFSQIRRAKVTIGSNTTCALKAAKDLKKNRVFCVSNVSSNTSDSELKSWLESCNIRVNNIFSAKTKFTNTASFRVNINADDAEKFMADSTWGSSIIIRDWVFKQATKPDDV